ncbi:hypothetical protein BJV78DRAFT_1238365 [Lactifluus subvellereus]|nr:hypothetical protein BJV78DRAFT_1238365 [Lactifluus subvellereus]
MQTRRTLDSTTLETLAAALTRSNSERLMPDPSIAIAEAFNQFSQATVSAVCRNTPRLRTRNVCKIKSTEDDLRSLQRERDDALGDLNASKDQTRVWVAEVDKWKSEADTALIVVRHTSAAQVYKFFQPNHGFDAEHSPS